MRPDALPPTFDLPGLLAAGALALVPLVALGVLRLPLRRQLLTALARMALQLGSLGLLLEVLFRAEHAALTLGWWLVMMTVAARTVLGRLPARPRGLFWVALAAVGGGASLVLAWCLAVVLRPDHLLAAPLLIPLGGMILGNSMNGATLALEQHLTRLSSAEGRREWETLLGLGAAPADARRRLLGRGLRTALLPTLNTTATVGLVSIPGMMTGQLLGGSPPATALLYQALILLAILASVTLSAWWAMRLAHGRLVDPDGLLRETHPSP
jgi:putative ABC transport system permease protein